MHMFDDEIRYKITKVLAKIRQVDTIYLLSVINQKLIHPIQPESPNLTEGFVQKFHFLCGLIVSSPTVHVHRLYKNSNLLDEILNLTNEIFEEYSNLWLSQPSLDGTAEEERIREYSAGLLAFLTALHEPKLGSTEQFIQLTLEQFEPFDDQLTSYVGLTARQIVDISWEIIVKIRDQYQAVINHYGSIQRNSLKKISTVQSGLKDNEQMFRNAFLISDQYLKNEFGEEIVDSYFKIFSFSTGSINKEFRLPTDFNQLDLKSFMQIDNGKFYAIEFTRLLHIIPDVLERLLTQSQYARRFFEHRDKFAHKKAVQLLEKVFSSYPLYENAYYGYNDSREFETDILIPIGKTLIICEVKAKSLRNPLHTEGNIQKIKKDFQESIQKGYNQALRTLNYIYSNKPAKFVSKNGKLLCEFKEADFDTYHLLIITQESFGALATDLSILLSKSPDSRYPIAVSLFDLELIVSLVNKPQKLLEYFEQRVKLNGLVFSHDELDYAGYYLTNDNLDFHQQLEIDSNNLLNHQLVLDPKFSKIFDLDWLKKHDANTAKYSKLKAISVESSKTEIKNVGLKRKGRNRNMPCPCKSGLKYKKCCGKT